MEHIGSIIPRVLQDIQRRTKPMAISVSYEDGRSILRFVCAMCGRQITDAETAMVAWWMRKGYDGSEGVILHKACLDTFEGACKACLGPGMLATEELVDAHFYLGHNAHITEAMADEARERCSVLETVR